MPRNAERLPSLTVVSALIDYSPLLGTFKRRIGSPRSPTGSDALTRSSSGNLVIRLRGGEYSPARMAWLFKTGVWPESTQYVLPRDGDRTNFAAANLYVHDSADTERARVTGYYSSAEEAQQAIVMRKAAAVHEQAEGIRRYVHDKTLELDALRAKLIELDAQVQKMTGGKVPPKFQHLFRSAPKQ